MFQNLLTSYFKCHSASGLFPYFDFFSPFFIAMFFEPWSSLVSFSMDWKICPAGQIRFAFSRINFDVPTLQTRPLYQSSLVSVKISLPHHSFPTVLTWIFRLRETILLCEFTFLYDLFRTDLLTGFISSNSAGFYNTISRAACPTTGNYLKAFRVSELHLIPFF